MMASHPSSAWVHVLCRFLFPAVFGRVREFRKSHGQALLAFVLRDYASLRLFRKVEVNDGFRWYFEFRSRHSWFFSDTDAVLDEWVWLMTGVSGFVRTARSSGSRSGFFDLSTCWDWMRQIFLTFRIWRLFDEQAERIIRLYRQDCRFLQVYETCLQRLQDTPLAVIEQAALSDGVNLDTEGIMPPYRLFPDGRLEVGMACLLDGMPKVTIRPNPRGRDFLHSTCYQEGQSLNGLSLSFCLRLAELPLPYLRYRQNCLQAQKVICRIHDDFLRRISEHGYAAPFLDAFCRSAGLVDCPRVQREKAVLARWNEFLAYASERRDLPDKIATLTWMAGPHLTHYLARVWGQPSLQRLAAQDEGACLALLRDPSVIADWAESDGRRRIALLRVGCPQTWRLFLRFYAFLKAFYRDRYRYNLLADVGCTSLPWLRPLCNKLGRSSIRLLVSRCSIQADDLVRFQTRAGTVWEAFRMDEGQNRLYELLKVAVRTAPGGSEWSLLADTVDYRVRVTRGFRHDMSFQSLQVFCRKAQTSGRKNGGKGTGGKVGGSRKIGKIPPTGVRFHPRNSASSLPEQDVLSLLHRLRRTFGPVGVLFRSGADCDPWGPDSGSEGSDLFNGCSSRWVEMFIDEGFTVCRMEQDARGRLLSLPSAEGCAVWVAFSFASDTVSGHRFLRLLIHRLIEDSFPFSDSADSAADPHLFSLRHLSRSSVPFLLHLSVYQRPGRLSFGVDPLWFRVGRSPFATPSGTPSVSALGSSSVTPTGRPSGQAALSRADMRALAAGVDSWYWLRGFPCLSLFNYHPAGGDEGTASRRDWRIRYLIWDFKGNPQQSDSEEVIRRRNRRAVDRLVPMFDCLLRFCFGGLLPRLTLVCAPSSRRSVHELRYRYFADRLCRSTGMANGFPHIRVVRDGEAKHTGGKVPALLDYDDAFFQGRCVLLFDDVITKGETMHTLRDELQRRGAWVVGGLSIGHTNHTVSRDGWLHCLLERQCPPYRDFVAD